MKKLISFLLCLVLLLSLQPSAFAADMGAEEAAEALHAFGLFSGVGTGPDGAPVYDLDRAPTRHEAITMLVRLLGAEGTARAGDWASPFADVAPWASPYVGYAYAHGLTSGVSETAFGGEAAVTATEYLSFVLRALGYSSGTDFRWNAAWELSDALGVTDGEYPSGAPFTRGDAALISYRALSARCKDSGVSLLESLGPVVRGPETEAQSFFEIHYLDVGQADAALVLCDGAAMLVDGGNAEDSSLIYSYLRDHSVSYLDYVVCTHPHEDHVGGLAGALNYADAGAALCPVTDYDSRAFESFTRYLGRKGVSITVPSPGDRFSLGSAEVEILGPLRYAEDMNNNSIVLRVDYGETSFLFTGDMEREEERELLEAGAALKCTVLKVGHHGSGSSTGYAFLYHAAPEYAVISCGADNPYGHPAEAVLSRLRDASVGVYRTDRQGTILCASDGKSVSFTTEREDAADAGAGDTDGALSHAYVLNRNSMVFHLPSCVYAGRISEKNRLLCDGTREEVLAMDYTPCRVCKP